MIPGEFDRRAPREPGPSRFGGPAKHALAPVIAVLAAIYFTIDALFLWIVRPVARRLSGLAISVRIGAWVRTLGPYQTLVLFLVPLIILEPVKPVAAYLVATRHVVLGMLVLGIGEVLKVTIVERLFHVGRDKLMTIPAFAWSYNLAMRWLGYLQSLPPWQAVMRRYIAIKARARRLLTLARRRWALACGYVRGRTGRSPTVPRSTE